MEFEAYPSSPSSRKDVRVFLRVQNILHRSDSVLLPVSLLLVGTSLVTYQHLTDSDTGRHSIRNFLAKILVSMFPLAILEKRILSCSDPVGLFAKFSAKVLLMHACFLGLRVASMAFPDVQVGSYKYSNLASFFMACGLLPTVFGLRPSVASIVEHREVWALAFVALCIALAEVILLGPISFSRLWRRRNRVMEDFIGTGSDYVEILSFVPAVWIAFRRDASSSSTSAGQPGVADSQRRALCLFAFLALFYLVEDIYNAYGVMRFAPLASAGHVAHYLLLLDFATFVLAHLYDEEKHGKLRGSLLNWVADVCGV
mmetsp:Transcript_86838/g.281195  ORF Transcript_86838/g.281195 Transcript_86838/m.281195 type:complete len:314 (-) Transcript_86838:296-1237(-)